jgi:hypothetical protein
MTTPTPLEYKELNGLTLTFPARTGLVFTLINEDMPTAATSEIDDTDLSSNVKKTIPSAVVDQGEVSYVCRYVPGIMIPIGQPDETIVLNMPLLPGQTVAGTWTFQGHITKAGGAKAANGTIARTSVTLKVNSAPVWAEGHA